MIESLSPATHIYIISPKSCLSFISGLWRSNMFDIMMFALLAMVTSQPSPVPVKSFCKHQHSPGAPDLPVLTARWKAN